MRINRTICLVCSILFAFSCTPLSEKLDRIEERGNPIIGALHDYRKDHSIYPESIDDLIPGYLDEIKTPEWGLNEWIYTVHENQFHLEVHESEQTGDGNSHWFRYAGDEYGWQYGD